jgi:short-chain fatty acids transporter
MLQLFWAVPVVAMTGIKVQRVMGHTVITLLVSLVIYLAGLVLIS